MWHNASKTIFPLSHFHQKSLSKLAFKVDGESYMSFPPSTLAFTVSSDISRTPAISSVPLESRGLIFHGDLKETCRSITDSPAGKCGPLWSWRRTHLFKSKTRNEVHCPAGSTQPRYIFSPHHPFQIILHLAVSSSPRMGLEIRIKYFKSQQLQNKQNRSFWRVVVCGLARRKE